MTSIIVRRSGSGYVAGPAATRMLRGKPTVYLLKSHWAATHEDAFRIAWTEHVGDASAPTPKGRQRARTGTRRPLKPGSQNARILAHLRDGLPLTARTAYERYGTMALHSRIAELRARGEPIIGMPSPWGPHYIYMMDPAA